MNFKYGTAICALLMLVSATTGSSGSAATSTNSVTVPQLPAWLEPIVNAIRLILASYVPSIRPDCDVGDGGISPIDVYLMKLDKYGTLQSTSIKEDQIEALFGHRRYKCIRVVAGGYQERYNCTAPLSVVEAYTLETECAVIYVDWQKAAGSYCADLPITPIPPGELPAVTLAKSLECYLKTAQTVPVVARFLAKLLKLICRKAEIHFHNVHLTGYSLGAQLLGVTSRYMGDSKWSRAGVLIGLDPAGPLFDTKVASPCGQWHMNPTDAACTTMINSNIAVLGTTKLDAADAAYIIDGGVIQTNICKDRCAAEAASDFEEALGCVVCSHGACGKVAIHSIEGNWIPVRRYPDDHSSHLYWKNLNLKCHLRGIFENTQVIPVKPFSDKYELC